MLKKVTHPSLGEVIFHRVKGHIPKKNQNTVDHFLISSNNFPWFFTNTTVLTKPKDLSKFEDVSMMGHMFITHKNGVSNLNSEYFHPIIEQINLPGLIKKYKLPHNIIRSQANLFLKRDRLIEPCPHIDFKNVRHLVVLYYVNNCDGDTIFYNLSDCDDHRLNEMKVWRRESPRKGDFVIFDGRIFHSPTCPTKSICRSTLNFDFSIDVANTPSVFINKEK